LYLLVRAIQHVLLDHRSYYFELQVGAHCVWPTGVVLAIEGRYDDDFFFFFGGARGGGRGWLWWHDVSCPAFFCWLELVGSNFQTVNLKDFKQLREFLFVRYVTSGNDYAMYNAV
jgi:hypothetical protein